MITECRVGTPAKGKENPDPEICANIMICLIKVTKFLLSRQIKMMETAFINEGGLIEGMLKQE